MFVKLISHFKTKIQVERFVIYPYLLMQWHLNYNIKPAQTFTVVLFQFTASLFQRIHATGITS